MKPPSQRWPQDRARPRRPTSGPVSAMIGRSVAADRPSSPTASKIAVPANVSLAIWTAIAASCRSTDAPPITELARSDRGNDGVLLAACWSHVRRKFYELHAAGSSVVASQTVAQMARRGPPRRPCAARTRSHRRTCKGSTMSAARVGSTQIICGAAANASLFMPVLMTLQQSVRISPSALGAWLCGHRLTFKKVRARTGAGLPRRAEAAPEVVRRPARSRSGEAHVHRR